jgi:hypothetical protein
MTYDENYNHYAKDGNSLIGFGMFNWKKKKENAMFDRYDTDSKRTLILHRVLA